MSIKKVIIATVLALAMVAMVAPAATQAATLSELMAQISALQAQLVALQGGSQAAGTGLCAGVTFERTLVVGSTGTDVKCLQQMLSVTPMSGYFGQITLAAVRAYQTSKGFVPANQVGPMTRAALNASLAAVTPAGSFPAGCTSAAGFSSTTGQSCSAVGNFPAGCTSASGYSPTTGVSCSTGASTTPGATGFLSIPNLSPAPASDTSGNITATSGVPVLGVNVKAIGSNMTVSSAKVQLAITGGDYPSTVVQTLSVYDGSTLLGTYPVNTSTVIKNSTDYYVILSGFNFMIPANVTKTLTIKADFNPGLETNRTLTINLYGTDAVRGVDGMGAYATAGLATTKVYTIGYATVGASTLVVSANTATPKATSVNVNVDNGTTGVPMLVFNTKSTTGASVITDVVVTAQGDNTAVAKMTGVSLYDGSTLLGSQSLSSAVSGATATFTDLTVNVAKDATKTLTVKADFGATVTNSSSVYLSIATGAITYQKPDMTSTTTTGTAGSSTNVVVLFNGKAAILSFVSSSSTYTYNTTTPSLSYSTGVITFKAKADGGTLTALTNSTVKVKWNSTILSTSDVSVDVSPVGDTADGSEATVTVTMTVPRATSGTGFVNFNIYEIDWTVGGTSATQIWGLSDDYKTPYVNVQ